MHNCTYPGRPVPEGERDWTAGLRAIYLTHCFEEGGDLVKPKSLELADDRFGEDVTYVPVISVEQTGINELPQAVARYFAFKTGGEVAADIVQVNKTYHTDAKAMARLLSRPIFYGPVTKGDKYVLVRYDHDGRDHSRTGRPYTAPRWPGPRPNRIDKCEPS